MAENPTLIDHAILRSLHRIHRQLSDLSSRLKRGPMQVKAGEAAVDAASAEVEAARGTLKQARMASDEKQLQLKTREQSIESLGAKLNTAATNREFQTIKEQIAADRQANDVLSDEILEALEGIDTLESVVTKAEEALGQREKEHKAMVVQVEGSMDSLKAELERVQAELIETEKGLPSSAMEQYNRLVRSRGEDSLAEVEGESCGNCGATFAPQMMNRLLMSHLLACHACAAYLYLPENR